MSRTLTSGQEAVRAGAANGEFSYHDLIELILPWAPGDTAPVVIRAATSALTVPTALDFEDFTEIAFVGALARPALTSEYNTWQTALAAAQLVSLAALQSAAKGLIDGLFSSGAYTARNRTDDEFITDLYHAYLGRDADPTGKAGWTALLPSIGRTGVRDGVGGSPEFNGRVDLFGDNITFPNYLRSPGECSLTEGSASQDLVEVQLVNLSSTYSAYLGDNRRHFGGGRAIYRRAIKTGYEQWEPDTLLDGIGRWTMVDALTAKITILADDSRTGLDVIEQVTQRCAAVYKGAGCNSPDPSSSCSRIFTDTVNGCPSKLKALRITDVTVTDNRPSYIGVPPLSLNTANPATTGLPTTGGLNNGWPRDFDPEDPRLRNGWRMPIQLQ
jgi:hypothetical protein